MNFIWSSAAGCYGTKLRYAGIKFNLTLPSQDLGYQRGLKIYNYWEAFINKQVIIHNYVFTEQ